jgi:hypothetical protein
VRYQADRQIGVSRQPAELGHHQRRSVNATRRVEIADSLQRECDRV